MFKIGVKVKLLTIVGRPTGTIVCEYRDPHNVNNYLIWVRLEDGTLLKDVNGSEIEGL